MAEFAWRGKTTSGKARQGLMEAASKVAVIQTLRRESISVTSVRERGKEIALPRLSQGVSQKELAVFTRQLSVMIDAGLPIVPSLELLAEQQENLSLRRVLASVRSEVESGARLCDAMGAHPKVFGDLYCHMIAAAEAGGILDVILRRLAAYIEKSVRLRRAVRSALVYPATVVSIAVLVVVVILWKVIPTFEQLFVSLGSELPLPTRITISASRFLGRFMPVVVVALAAAFVGIRAWYRTHRGRRVLDALLLSLPVVGLLLRKVAVARFCRTLATLLTSGVPLLEAMEITARTAGNAIIEDAVMTVRRCVEEGRTLAEPLAETEVFPRLVTRMIAVGEQTGSLDAMLQKIADFYEEDVDSAIEELMALLEPVMILFLGVTIGGIVISMYLPMFKIINNM